MDATRLRSHVCDRRAAVLFRSRQAVSQPRFSHQTCALGAGWFERADLSFDHLSGRRQLGSSVGRAYSRAPDRPALARILDRNHYGGPRHRLWFGLRSGMMANSLLLFFEWMESTPVAQAIRH